MCAGVCVIVMLVILYTRSSNINWCDNIGSAYFMKMAIKTTAARGNNRKGNKYNSSEMSLFFSIVLSATRMR